MGRIARFVSCQGRSGRVEFVATLAVLSPAWMVFFVAPQIVEGFPLWLAFVLLFAPPLLALPVVVRRMHDLNFPALWAWAYTFALRLALVALQFAGVHSHAVRDEIGLSMLALGGLYIAAAPGTPGENDFGAPNRLFAR